MLAWALLSGGSTPAPKQTQTTGVTTTATHHSTGTATVPTRARRPTTHSHPVHIATTGLIPGATGSAVKVLQTALTRLGYHLGAVDGIYGGKTVAAVKAFQHAHALSPDGLVGPHTAAALETALARR